ncbi:helix-turn-helix domain-containing protein [Streptomyces rapamycinicus]|uniref:Tetratricopeptide (TPR) repeat protein/transcriptional regulator with XRE-family HTH domain n=1 Tax=Streptomyces rapamycinicus TaxID=1226757 RepID=A0ABR6LA45_9ACTN|nr:helix-turn-helix domain-containing protein [Streptomyces rapamycinicus]MBB4779049.1 tetratricopeptide (TPR) repeat protein/transcriptional regulator with XRE-family HTH domain [Streptomyces rapamycinicus]MBB4787241.1 tetratricopeptide (TPR) repeat protein/transcriptional regulator with XRE-family HTH domain [Streptomyces rapamycinicus]
MQDPDGLVRQSAAAFAAELIRLRAGRGLSQLALARRMGYDKSYVSHVERCTQAPTQPFARQADHVLGSGEALRRLWHAYHTAHAAKRRQCRPAPSPVLPTPEDAGRPDEPGHAAEHDRAGAPDGRTTVVGDGRQAPGEGSSVPASIGLRGATGVQVLEYSAQHLDQLPPPAPITLHTTLPRDVADFTGRAEELSRLLRAADEGQAQVVSIHTVDGMPGVGKTALVIHTAHLLADDYPDGHRFVRLGTHTPGAAPADPAGVLTQLLLSLGISPRNIPQSLEEKAGMWRDALTGRRMLLILDDAASAAQVEPLLPASKDCLVLVTSRRRLPDLDGASPLPLNTLPPLQAADLFIRVSRRTPTASDRSAVTQAVELCGHLPLAITLLAGRLAHHQAWNIKEFADEFATAQDRLAELEAGDRALAASFDLSYQHLAPDLQRLYRRLGLHPGPDTDPYATAALDNIPLATARRRLNELYAAHLIDEPAPRRYRLHDLLRTYAHTLARQDPSSDRGQAVTRLIDYYHHTARTADRYLSTVPRQDNTAASPSTTAPALATRDQALAWMRAELPNLLATAHHAATDHLPHAAALAHTMAAFLDQEGHWAEAIALHEAAAHTAHTLNSPDAEAHAVLDLGWVRRRTGNSPAAGELAQRAYDLYHSLDNRLGQANALRALGLVRQMTGDYTEAAQLAQRAYDLYHSLSNRAGQANALLDLCRVRRRTGDYPEAGELAQRAYDLYHSLDNRLGQANARLDLGWVRRLTGDYPEAGGLAQQAYDLYRALGNRQNEAWALLELGQINRDSRNYTAAADLLERSRARFHELGDRKGEAEALTAAGDLQAATIGPEPALDTYRQALTLARQIHSPLDQAHALEGIASCHAALHHHREAVQSLREAIALYQRLGVAETARATDHLKQLETALRQSAHRGRGKEPHY